jgi:hypothetical protein
VVCSTCFRLADSGPEGTGYTLRLPEGWLVRAAPSLQLGLTLVLAVCSIAAKLGGVYLPVGTVSVLSTMEEATADLVGAEMASAIKVVCAQVAEEHGSGGSGGAVEIEAAFRQVSKATGASFKALEEIFATIDPKGKYYGTNAVDGGKGENFSRQWVCPSCSPGFEEFGLAFAPGDEPKPKP